MQVVRRLPLLSTPQATDWLRQSVASEPPQPTRTGAGPDPAWAEVWSKVLFVGGWASIAAEARSRGLAAWWVADDGRLEMTAAARALTIWVASEAG